LPNYVRKYSQIIATSDGYAARSRNLLHFKDIVTVIPNGVDCERFNPTVASDDIKDKLDIHGKFIILFVAALTKWHRYKGLDVLLDALRLAVREERDLVLIVVGDGELRPEFELMSRSLSVHKNVIFAGNVSYEKLPHFYTACDVLMLPSKDMSEGFGLTILEANAAGKPCIGSKIGGIPSIIKNGFNGLLVPPNDSLALANAILELIRNPEERGKMGRNGREVALLHDWKRTAAMVEEVYLARVS
jgi:glycosyltransferase involved in cell wall biosynthesis